jgi:tRNA pseudouridine38-40 synthase
MLRNIKLTIEYDGTNFKGWQTQAASGDKAASKEQRTIQDEIEKILKKLFKNNIHVIGSGRTDSGVHALGQVANFKTHSAMTIERIQRALNANLPEDIAVVKTEEVSKDFHARYTVKSKTYRYTILNRPGRCALQRNFVLHYPHTLDLRTMREEAKCLVGQHDFKSFAASPAKEQKIKKTNTVRTIKRFVITKKGEFITCDIEANGFLYRMVRNIIGTLLDIGNGKLAKGSIKRILAQKDRGQAGATAKSKGLALLEVIY